MQTTLSIYLYKFIFIYKENTYDGKSFFSLAPTNTKCEHCWRIFPISLKRFVLMSKLCLCAWQRTIALSFIFSSIFTSWFSFFFSPLFLKHSRKNIHHTMRRAQFCFNLLLYSYYYVYMYVYVCGKKGCATRLRRRPVSKSMRMVFRDISSIDAPSENIHVCAVYSCIYILLYICEFIIMRIREKNVLHTNTHMVLLRIFKEVVTCVSFGFFCVLKCMRWKMNRNCVRI